jgi:hypothetical protein
MHGMIPINEKRCCAIFLKKGKKRKIAMMYGGHWSHKSAS